MDQPDLPDGGRRRRLVAVGVAALLLGGAAVLAWGGGRGAPAPAGPQPHADVEVVLFAGGTMTLGELRGRPAVVNFFASWCAPCAAEMPDFEAAHQRRADEVAFVGIALQDSPGSAMELVRRTGVTYPVAADPDGALYRVFGAVAMPTTVFLDAEGDVVERVSGALSAEQLEAHVAALLGS